MSDAGWVGALVFVGAVAFFAGFAAGAETACGHAVSGDFLYGWCPDVPKERAK